MPPVESRTIDSDAVLSGMCNYPIIVERQAAVKIAGTLNGSARVYGNVHVSGVHNGSLHVAGAATATIDGRHNGSVHVETGGVVIVEPRGRIAGSLHNAGRVVVRGEIGGSQSGAAVELDGGRVVPPTRIGADETHYYEWRD
ncbi:polymer-forming cytoskeletal protein [Salsipaludibacter albus]|uniref:polymer-forming cytoskeletal protein n=1 Tax=Salsipaludibacter albus TaxID=2849650 RepID=UPI001EE461CE|nr:polymer-forming cytoskeletal protein [Salsipaludibacter albus]MBY5163155.1 polymer-forming cytoskeletal protein [Salsipaludibacter albus]